GGRLATAPVPAQLRDRVRDVRGPELPVLHLLDRRRARGVLAVVAAPAPAGRATVVARAHPGRGDRQPGGPCARGRGHRLHPARVARPRVSGVQRRRRVRALRRDRVRARVAARPRAGAATGAERPGGPEWIDAWSWRCRTRGRERAWTGGWRRLGPRACRVVGSSA